MHESKPSVGRASDYSLENITASFRPNWFGSLWNIFGADFGNFIPRTMPSKISVVCSPSNELFRGPIELFSRLFQNISEESSIIDFRKIDFSDFIKLRNPLRHNPLFSSTYGWRENSKGVTMTGYKNHGTLEHFFFFFNLRINRKFQKNRPKEIYNNCNNI